MSIGASRRGLLRRKPAPGWGRIPSRNVSAMRGRTDVRQRAGGTAASARGTPSVARADACPQHARECPRLARRRPSGSGRRRPLPAIRQRSTGMAAMPTDAKASGRASHAGGAKADPAKRTRPKGRQRARDRRGHGTALFACATRSRAAMFGLRRPSIEPAVHEGHQAVGCGDAGGDGQDRQPCEWDAIEERTRRDVV